MGFVFFKAKTYRHAKGSKSLYWLNQFNDGYFTSKTQVFLFTNKRCIISLLNKFWFNIFSGNFKGRKKLFRKWKINGIRTTFYSSRPGLKIWINFVLLKQVWEVKIFALDGESVQRLITLPTSGVNYLSGITTFVSFPVRPDGAFICSIFGRSPQAKFVLGTAKIPNTKEFLKNWQRILNSHQGVWNFAKYGHAVTFRTQLT